MNNPRTDAAKAHDDSAMIDAIEPGPSQSDRGGALQDDIATQAEAAQVADPEREKRVAKGDTIEHGTEVRPDRARAPDA